MNIPANILVTVRQHQDGLGVEVAMIDHPAAIITTEQLRILYNAVLKDFAGVPGYGLRKENSVGDK